MNARLATGAALAAAFAAAIWWAPLWLFAIAALVLLLGALGEWNRLLPCHPAAACAIGAAFAAFCVAIFFAPQKWLWMSALCLAGALFWAWRAAQLFFASRPDDKNKPPVANLLQGVFVLLCAWCALVWMRAGHGGGAVIAMLLAICAADTFAYFVGRRFGRRKLAPQISPGKTVEGLFGGLFGAAAAGLCMAFAFSLGVFEAALWTLASFFAALFGAAGDLHESVLKRRAGVKDSGNLLPGHGGILDRLDGILAGAPAFAVIWNARAGLPL